MRFRLFLICLGVVIFSLASGLGLRFALAAWQEPTAAPPGDNVPAPINVGSGAQIKAGSLTIGGVFIVAGAGSGAVIGVPTGGNQGPGSLNAEKICINGVCLSSWVIADAFVQNGNSFGALATLGTNDNFPLAFETNSIERMRINTAGNVGIGTTSPSYKFVVSGASPRAYIWSTSGNPELNLGDGTNHWAIYRDAATDQLRFWRTDNRMVITSGGNVGIGTTSPQGILDIKQEPIVVTDHGVKGLILRKSRANTLDDVSQITFTFRDSPEPSAQSVIRSITTNSGDGRGRLEFSTRRLAGAEYTGQQLDWTPDLVINSAGNVGIGTISPITPLQIKSDGPYVQFEESDSGSKLWRIGGGGGNFIIGEDAAGTSRFLVQKDTGNVGIGTMSPSYTLDVSSSGARAINAATSNTDGYAVYGSATATGAVTNYGSYFKAAGDSGRGVYGEAAGTGGARGVFGFASGASGTNYGVYGQVTSLTGWAGYFAGGQGIYVEKDIKAGGCIGPVYVGQTATTYDGARGGYNTANTLCAAAFTGSHVCTTAEILNSINCNSPGRPTSGQSWVVNGPPGYTARANDCKGWTSNIGSGSEIAYGALWAWDASGGIGWVTTCNMANKFACCK